ncbi:tetratricopeptide repeat protein [Ohtaekwangia kribbensis]|jgi:tetratricopeptide (TPR) repeat protein|uniref:Tetratricopeptide repeat protein n=1 Tax=Ohtaekwangia kribbensis TaxID=688913 RepID=A0ABW3K1D0_9BACT
MAIFLLGLNSYTTAQTHSSKIDSLDNLLKTLPEDTTRVNTLLKLCGVLSYSDTKRVQEVATETIDLSQKIDFKKGEGKGYVYMGYYYHRLGNEPRAIEFLLKALAIFEAIPDNRQVAVCNNNVGVIYLSQDDTKSALLHFNKALSSWTDQGYKSGIARALGNIADVYETEKNDSLALQYYQRSLAINEETKDKSAVSNILNAMGEIYFRSQRYDESFKYQQRALQLAIETGSINLQSGIYTALSDLYLVRNNPGQAVSHAERALEIGKKIDSKRNVADSYLQLSKVYAAAKNYPKAYEFQSLYVALNDSLKSSENLSNIEKVKANYELDKKELEIKALNHEMRVKIIRRNSFIAACLALLVIGALVYNRQHMIMKKRLEAKRQLLDFYTQNLREKSEMIDKINQDIETLKQKSAEEDTEIDKYNKILHAAILTDEDWENFKKAFEEVYPRFFAKLRYHYPDITVAELRLSALIKLKLSLKESASMLGISPESIKKSRYRLRKKFDLPEKETLEDFINKITYLKAAS